MKLPILSSVIILILVISHAIKRDNRMTEKLKKEFWERERNANFVRRQSLDNLDYISIPLDTLPTSILSSDPDISDCINTLTSLASERIVNFTGYTNTDLKMKYGAPNIDLLMEYDSRYTLLVRTLQNWASALYNNGYSNEAKAVLEFSISTGSDVKSSYELLVKIYKETNQAENISKLFIKANSLNSAMKAPIVHMLQEACQ